MNITIDMDQLEIFDWNQSLSEVIKEEISDEVRRAVKRELKNKNAELAKAVQAFANAQAELLRKEMENKMMDINNG